MTTDDLTMFTGDHDVLTMALKTDSLSPNSSNGFNEDKLPTSSSVTMGNAPKTAGLKVGAVVGRLTVGVGNLKS